MLFHFVSSSSQLHVSCCWDFCKYRCTIAQLCWCNRKCLKSRWYDIDYERWYNGGIVENSLRLHLKQQRWGNKFRIFSNFVIERRLRELLSYLYAVGDWNIRNDSFIGISERKKLVESRKSLTINTLSCSSYFCALVLSNKSEIYWVSSLLSLSPYHTHWQHIFTFRFSSNSWCESKLRERDVVTFTAQRDFRYLLNLQKVKESLRDLAVLWLNGSLSNINTKLDTFVGGITLTMRWYKAS